ncbi:MAG: helix-turn-helix domain-containing protein [Betaproteobacteria bacterium]
MRTDLSTPSRYSIHALAALASLPTRTVRFYIAQGLMDRPLGAKRGAWYEDRHLQQLLLIRRWTDAGLSLERVRELQAGSPEEAPPRPVKPGMVEVWSRVTLADGVEVQLEPGRAGMTPEQVRAFIQEVTLAYRRVRDPGSGAH